MTYLFQVSAYEESRLLPQVSKALEVRTEMISRKRLPGMWKLTDRFNSMNRGRRRSKLRTRVMSVICLALGLFLFLPAMMEPQELMVPLLVGAAAIGAGIGGLWRSFRHKKNPFEKGARMLLAHANDRIAGKKVTVSFEEDGMCVAVDGTNSTVVPWQALEYAIEAEDIFLFVHNERATLLQKSDLTVGTPEAFRQYIGEKTELMSCSDPHWNVMYSRRDAR